MAPSDPQDHVFSKLYKAFIKILIIVAKQF
jgi:hypothetical protein